MEKKTIIFETGAKSHEINDLILFADNTRRLADLRNEIYMQAVEPKDNDIMKLHISGFFGTGECEGYRAPIKHRVIDILRKRFNRLLYDTIDAYAREFPDDHYKAEDLTYDQKEEFCALYANDFDNWCIEHGHKIEY